MNFVQLEYEYSTVQYSTTTIMRKTSCVDKMNDINGTTSVLKTNTRRIVIIKRKKQAELEKAEKAEKVETILNNESQCENTLELATEQHIVMKYFDTFMKAFYRFDVLCTRFNSLTYLENREYRLSLAQPAQESGTTSCWTYCHHSPPSVGCIYGVGAPLTENIPTYKYLFVLEMNNTINKIMGIGLIKNIVCKKMQGAAVYSNSKYNKFIYKSNFHIQLIQPRCLIENPYLDSNGRSANDALHSKDMYEDTIPEEYVEYFENVLNPICFKGKTNLKRGSGFTRFPMKILTLDMLQKLIKLFMIVNPNNFNNIVVKRLVDIIEHSGDGDE